MLMTTLLHEDTALALIHRSIQVSKGVSIDTETNGLDSRGPRPAGFTTGVSVGWRDTDGINALYLPFKHEGPGNYRLERFLPALQELVTTKPVVFHNAKHDITTLSTLGLDVTTTSFYDTQVLAHMVNENRPYRNKKLDACASYYLGKNKVKSELFEWCVKHRGWAGVPAGIMAEYATWDAALTLELYEVLKPKLQAENLGPMWKHKERWTRFVMGMESAGIGVNTILAQQQMDIGLARMEAIRQELGGLNPSSPLDLYKLLCLELKLPEIKNPKTGKRTFDKEAMKEYDVILERLNNPVAQRVLEYRGWQKTVTSNYKPYLELLSNDGRLRPSYKLHGTVTGRMSCELPNLQQIPRESTKDWNGKLKSAFIASGGKRLWEFDFAQLELRLGTAYAKEPALVQAFAAGRDIFAEMAIALNMSRQDAKTMVYSITYGAGVNRVKNVFGISPSEARSRIENYYNSYPGFRRVSKQIERNVQLHGKAPIWSGRYRHFEYPEQAYKSFNSVIQGGAADIVERVGLALDEAGLNNNECRALLTVHDSYVFEIDEDKVETYRPEIVRVMEDVSNVCNVDFGVKFAVDSKEWGKAA